MDKELTAAHVRRAKAAAEALTRKPSRYPQAERCFPQLYPSLLILLTLMINLNLTSRRIASAYSTKASQSSGPLAPSWRTPTGPSPSLSSPLPSRHSSNP